MIGQRVAINHEGKKVEGEVSKVLNKQHCVVHWKIKEGKMTYKYNKIIPVEDLVSEIDYASIKEI